MQLYYTPNSPYARICRVAMRESGLGVRIKEVLATTRDTNSPLYQISPLARVPALVDGEVLIADTRDICAHFDAITGRHIWLPAETPQTRTQRHIAMGFLDGVAVWLRENGRPAGEQSPTVLEYETHRARIALGWLGSFGPGPDRWDFTMLAITCTIDIARQRGMASGWNHVAPDLMHRVDVALARPALAETAPGA